MQSGIATGSTRETDTRDSAATRRLYSGLRGEGLTRLLRGWLTRTDLRLWAQPTGASKTRARKRDANRKMAPPISGIGPLRGCLEVSPPCADTLSKPLHEQESPGEQPQGASAAGAKRRRGQAPGGWLPGASFRVASRLVIGKAATARRALTGEGRFVTAPQAPARDRRSPSSLPQPNSPEPPSPRRSASTRRSSRRPSSPGTQARPSTNL